MFSDSELVLLRSILQQDLLKAIWETLYMTFVPAAAAFVIGLPLGVLLVTGDEGGIRPLPKALMTFGVSRSIDYPLHLTPSQCSSTHHTRLHRYV